ncbi:hypothetical protein [Sporosarcina aquimarina]|uniref:Uncharacterized protein n=1 Tax=Sporosarcina aquimarina TaxID=114975 RepID=A0ABU4G0U9_9BACL|nr:hypothetical protein [Sporosarcina aquimarina]MDW0110585.1 hypothetical protein [Sporosarcina aquimarina]
MGFLLIIFIALGAASLIFQGLMYIKQFHLNLGVRTINAILGLIIAYIAFTSFPEGDTMEKTVAAALGVSAVIGLVLSFVKREALAGKIFLSLSVLGGLVFLFFGM